jgi:cell division protein FtsZ
MSIKLKLPDLTELRPRIVVIGAGGAGGNAVNNMIHAGIEGVEFIAANTDAQALAMSSAGNRIQMGVSITEGLGAGSKPEIGAAAAEEAIEEIRAAIDGSHMLFITAGMGGGTGTGGAPVIARAAKELGVLTVAVVSKPFEFEGQRRMRVADQGVAELSKYVDTLIVIPNQNLFRIANEKTTFVDAFQRADDVLRSGVSCITDLMVKEGLINLDFADVRTVMQNMGTALMGTGEATGEKRALKSAEAAITNPLLGEITMRGAKGLLVSITGSHDMTLYEVEEAASRIRREVDPDSNPDINIIVGATFDPELEGRIRVSVVATGIESSLVYGNMRRPPEQKEPLTSRLYGNGAKQAEAPRGAPPQQQRAPEPRPGMRQAPVHPGHFEPAAPQTPIKPPRRPLTSDDFPELNGRGGESAPANQRRGGKRSSIFDWMSGRNRGRDTSSQGGSVSDKPHGGKSGGQSPVIIERLGDPRNGDDENGVRQRGEPSLGGRKGAYDANDPIEIPEFFKRPNG